MSLIYNATFDSQTRVLSLLDKAGNVISSCEVPSKEELVDDPNKPLMLRAIADNSSVTLSKKGTLSNTYQTSTNGKDWTDYTLGTKISLNNEDVVYFRCSNHPTTQFSSNYVQFYMGGKLEAWHNAYSMISSSFTNTSTRVGPYGMYALFKDCKSLTKAPLLLNALSPYCYNAMFYGCSALTQAPALPATTLADHCYNDMFYGCTALTQSPELPATTLEYYCYGSMFYGCTSLTQVPLLPATTLVESCYSYMFYGCTALTQSPELPAMTLERYCYKYMFYGCSNLKEVRISATKTTTDALYNWLEGVSATGDFYCDPNATIFPTYGAFGIPENWKRWVYGAEDTGTTTTLYHNGASETVRVGTSSYGVCYALQGWVGFKSLAEMHSLGYTLGEQTVVTLYEDEHPMSVYACDVNDNDGFTETIYDIGDGEGYLTIERQNEKRYYVTPTPFTGLTLKATEYSSVTLESSGYIRSTYRVDTGSGWRDYTLGTKIYLSAGKICRWDCSKHMLRHNDSNYVQFVMTGKVEASGNCLSLIRKNFENVSTMPNYAFSKLFNACTALTKAPELPATTLSEYCYYYMFYKCGSLTKAPALPATSLASDCYYCMFSGCSKLKEVRIAATTTATHALGTWLSGVSATGDFYCDPNATIFPSGESGIPANWTRHALADYPATP